MCSGVLRIVSGFLFRQHGMQKLFGYPSALPGGKPLLASLYGVAGILEFFGGRLTCWASSLGHIVVTT